MYPELAQQPIKTASVAPSPSPSTPPRLVALLMHWTYYNLYCHLRQIRTSPLPPYLLTNLEGHRMKKKNLPHSTNILRDRMEFCWSWFHQNRVDCSHSVFMIEGTIFTRTWKWGDFTTSVGVNIPLMCMIVQRGP